MWHLKLWREGEDGFIETRSELCMCVWAGGRGRGGGGVRVVRVCMRACVRLSVCASVRARVSLRLCARAVRALVRWCFDAAVRSWVYPRVCERPRTERRGDSAGPFDRLKTFWRRGTCRKLAAASQPANRISGRPRQKRRDCAPARQKPSPPCRNHPHG